MAFTTEELIQIGLLIAIIIVLGYTAYNYLKNKGLLDKMLNKKIKPKKEETKSLSFASNRKMRGLEKLIPDKKLSLKPRLTELRLENPEGLWEPEEESFLEKKKIEVKPEPETKKTGVKEIQQMVKKAGEQKSFLEKIREKIKTEKQSFLEKKNAAFVSEQKTKTEEMKIKPRTKETAKSKGKFAFNPKKQFSEKKTEKIIQTPVSLEKKIKEVQKEKESKRLLDRIPLNKLKSYISQGKFAFKKTEEKKEPAEKKPFTAKQEPAKTEALKEKPDIGKKLEEKIKQYEERMKNIREGKTKNEVLFESKEEKEKHEQKFVQKILDSKEDELEKISKAIEPKTDKKWQQEKKETIEALKKEFSELEKTEQKDLWKQPKQEPAEKPEIKEKPKARETTVLKPKKSLKEFKSNGKFAFSAEKKKPIEQKTKETQKPVIKKQPQKTETKSDIQEEMRKLMEERRKQLQKSAEQKTKPIQKPIQKPELKPAEKSMPTEKPKIKTAPKPKPKPVKTESKKKKGLFERIGLTREKINFTKEEEDQIQKIMIVLKGKTSEYSREEMKEAMQNLGYQKKIIEEAVRRLYG